MWARRAEPARPAALLAGRAISFDDRGYLSRGSRLGRRGRSLVSLDNGGPLAGLFGALCRWLLGLGGCEESR